jgi:hypothetical protein
MRSQGPRNDYSFFGLLLSSIIASGAMTFSSVSVIGNALRRRRRFIVTRGPIADPQQEPRYRTSAVG